MMYVAFLFLCLLLKRNFYCDPSFPVVRVLVPRHESLPILLGTILEGHPKMHVLPQSTEGFSTRNVGIYYGFNVGIFPWIIDGTSKGDW